MESFTLLGLALLGAGATAISGILFYETKWKAHRRRRLERDHARSKTGRSTR